jgi:2-oxoglutarate ferredoxin oxidoreductase subunit alpha
VQEAADLMQDAFDLADYYKNPTLVLGDGLIGQMMEPCEFREGRAACKALEPKNWAATGNKRGRPRAIINSLFLDPEALERHNQDLQKKYDAMARDDVRFATHGADAPYDILLVAYGTVARVCSTAVDGLRAAGLGVALVRPITLFPFPFQAVREAAAKARLVLVVELSCGQMLEDVQLAVGETRPVHFLGRQGGLLVSPEQVVARVKELVAHPKEARRVG